MTRLFKRTLLAEYLRYAFARATTLIFVTLFNMSLVISCGFFVFGKYYSAITVVIIYLFILLVYAWLQWLMFKRYKNFSK